MISEQLNRLIITPVLKKFEMHSPTAVNLLLATCAQESNMGQFIAQLHGPALGIFQMEPATHDDLWTEVVNKHGKILAAMGSLVPPSILRENKIPVPDLLVYNLRYAAIMCRLAYWRVPEPLPSADDMDGLWEYYKNHYNTAGGSATKEQFVANWNSHVRGNEEQVT